MNTPKVSVIIPVYNVGHFIERCARSLFEQSLDDIEFIFVDDCSPDNSVAVLQRIMEEYPERKDHVTILRHNINKGLPFARRTGFEAATGEYIAHCDSDDWVEKTIYEKMYAKAREEDLDMVICGYSYHDGTEPIKSFTNISRHNDIYRSMLASKIGHNLWNKLIKKDIYSNDILWPQHNMLEDSLLVIQLAYFCKSFGVLDMSLYNYRMNSEGMCISPMTPIKFQDARSNIEAEITFLKEKGMDRKYPKEVQFQTCRIINTATKLPREQFKALCPKVSPRLFFLSTWPLIQKVGFITKVLGIHGLLGNIRKYFRA